MNRPKEIKKHSSVWMRQSYADVLRDPNPFPPNPNPVHHAPGNPIQNGGPRQPKPSLCMAPRQRNPLSFRGSCDQATAMTRRFRQLSTSSNRVENEPFFASNLMYYPHLPQPLWVGRYQTYSEIKEALSSGNLSQIRLPLPSELSQYRGGSSLAPRVPGLPDEPPSPAPSRRYSMTRRNGACTGTALANIMLTAKSHLLRQPYPEFHLQLQRQLQKPVRDPILAQFQTHREGHVGLEPIGLGGNLLEANGSSQPSTSEAAQKQAMNTKNSKNSKTNSSGGASSSKKCK
ncbi:uncharacterized protein LOC128266041 [Drosophila gunungcola]|uniref:Uncharacterized protein n=1 Tax=Drosophila gunungcola TaxID=103775 RepID=A0A9P9Y9T7_9MUSC|nr:uncharacterized protein LOC128266041 [Drosophila gunungcola]KAI8033043.1 hypothetical protein M5D96_014207 [Drosophila gunungcola]